MNAQNDNEIINNNSRMNDILLDIYQLFFPDELYFIWLTHIGEIGIGKQLQEEWQNNRKQFENHIQKWVKIQLGLIKQKNRNDLNTHMRLLSDQKQLDQNLNVIFYYVQNALSRALVRILNFDLTIEDIKINRSDNKDGNLNNQLQFCGKDNDDEEDGIVFDDLDSINSFERRNKDVEEQSIIQSVKQNINRPRFHPLTPSFRMKQRVFRVIEQMEEELDTTFVTLNVIWKQNRFEDIGQNLIFEQKENQKQKQKGKQSNDGLMLNRVDDDYPTIFGGGGMWSRRWGKFPKLNEQQEKERNESNFRKPRNLEKNPEDDQQKNLRFFVGKCNPELLGMRTLMKGLWESGTRRIQASQIQPDNANLTPFPRVLQSFSAPHAPLVPCNHKCGIVGNVNVWKRMFVVHSHRGHNRNFPTRAKMITRKQLDDIFETNISTIEQQKSKDEIDNEEQLKVDNNDQSAISQQQLIQATNQIKNLSIKKKQIQSLIPLSIANVNLDFIPVIPTKQQIQINPYGKLLKFIQDRHEYPKPIFILQGAAWDNYHRKGRSFYSCSETSASFGQNNQMFDPRYPVFALQRFKSLTKFCFPNTQPTNNTPIIKLPQFSSDFKAQFKKIIENREKMNKDRQLGKENEIETEGVISYNEVVRFRNEIRQLLSKDPRKFLDIFKTEDLTIFVDNAAQYYEIVEKQCQHIDIDVHFGSQIKQEQKPNEKENIDQKELIDDIELRNKQGLLIVGDIHGNFYALLKVLDIVDDVLLRNDPSRGKVVFLGDYIDRGIHSLECVILIIAYKLAFPDRIFLIRGNHESAGTRKFCDSFNLRIHTIFDKKTRKLFIQNPKSDEIKNIKILKHQFTHKFIKLFTCMPISCTVTLLYHISNQIVYNHKTQEIPKSQRSHIHENQTQTLDQTNTHNFQNLYPIIHSRRIQLNHGGITPIMPVASAEDECTSLPPEDQYQISEQLGFECNEVWTRNRAILKFTTWGDPSDYENIIQGRPPFCQETTDRYVRANGIDVVVRAHEDSKQGFYFPMHNGKVATIFSSDTYSQQTKGSVFLVRLSSPSERFNQDPFINQLPTTHNSLISQTSISPTSYIDSNPAKYLPFVPLLTFDAIQLESNRYVQKLNYSVDEVENASRETEIKKINLAVKRLNAHKQDEIKLQSTENEILQSFNINQLVDKGLSDDKSNRKDTPEQRINKLIDSIQTQIIKDKKFKQQLKQLENIKIYQFNLKQLLQFRISQRIKEKIQEVKEAT